MKAPRADRFAGGADAVPDTDMSEASQQKDHLRIGAYRSLFAPVIQTMMARIGTEMGIVG